MAMHRNGIIDADELYSLPSPSGNDQPNARHRPCRPATDGAQMHSDQYGTAIHEDLVHERLAAAHAINHDDDKSVGRTGLTPFLGRTAKQSRAFVNHIVLSLAIVMASLVALTRSVADQGIVAKRMLAKACTDLEVAVNALALAPRFTAMAINRRTVKAIHSAVDHAAGFASATITFLKQVLLYILFRYQRVVLCLLDTTVMSATNAVASNAKIVAEAVTNEVRAISQTLSSSLNTVNAQVNAANDIIRKIPSVPNMPFGFGGGNSISVPTIPNIELPGVIDRLEHFSVPSSFVQSLQDLSSKVPRLDDIENAVSNLLSGPFDDLSRTVKNALTNVSVPQIDMLPVPSNIEHVRFCYGTAYNLAWIDRMVEAITVSIWYGCFVIAIVMVAATLWYMIVEGWEHGVEERNVRRIANMIHRKNMLISDATDDTSSQRTTKNELHVRTLVSAARHPIPFAIHDGICTRVLRIDTTSPRISAHAIRIRWLMLYLSHPLVIACIVLGITGILAIRFQILILSLVASTVVPALANELDIATQGILERIGNAVNTVIDPYTSKINAAVKAVEEAINDKLFGWVRNTVQTVKTGVDTIINGFSEAVTAAFASVPPIQEALNSFAKCLLGGAAKTLETIAKNLERGTSVVLPRVDASDLILDASKLALAMDTVTSISNTTAGAQPVSSATRKLFQDQLLWLQRTYERTLWMQMLPFTVALCMGLAVVLFGILVVVFDLVASSKSSRSDDTDSFESYTEEVEYNVIVR